MNFLKNNKLILSITAVIAVLLVVGGVKANEALENLRINIENCNECVFESSVLANGGEFSEELFGGVTHHGSVDISDTATINELAFGAGNSKSLTFTAGATTTPGGLFTIQNTGTQKVCNVAEVNITTKVEGSIFFSVATSTLADSFSGSGTGIMATTTIATGTVALLNSVDSSGTSGLDSFVWDNGVYLLGQIEGIGINASSSDYSTAAGKAYISCHK